MARKNANAGDGTPTAASDGSGNAGTDSGASAIFTSNEPIVINPADIERNAGSGGDSSNGTADEPVRKRRGRKPGSTNKKSQTPLSVNGLEALLYSSHMMLASMMQAPGLALDKEESTRLAEATANVARHYNVEASEKALDWTNLIMALGMIYGPRLIEFRRVQGEKRKTAAKANPDQPDLPFRAPVHQQSSIRTQ